MDVLEPALSQHRQDTIHLAWYEAQSCQERNRSALQSTSVPDWTYIREESWLHRRPRVKHEGPYHQTLPVVLLPASSNTYGSTLTSSAIRTLVHAFICTRVDFSNSLLYGTSAYLLDRLQSVLNSAACLILRIGKYDPISVAIRRDLHWLPVPFRIRNKLNSITSNCLAGRAPEYLIQLCHSVNDIPARRNLQLSSQVQRYRKERSGRRGFSISSPQLWNLLPADIRLLHNEHQLFRTRLKTHYMQQSMLHHWGSMSTVWSLLLLLLLLLSTSTYKVAVESPLFPACLTSILHLIQMAWEGCHDVVKLIINLLLLLNNKYVCK